ncbi:MULTISPECIES: spore coat protein CotJB [Paenibacillus]|uniref:spore coat protein CotJB n=1 Tax=Paenibacillus TaxID=44249 RepID=UPI00021BBD94|nr:MULTISPECIES: spore coat protein CotJB [Paenibacillus]MEE4570715.1 spore coat protein CotJB [Paenibacillus polymyxa]WPQ58431.1 spore coat protein CotJB [Paenibacillus polymyxa]CCC84474.1 proteinCotJB [Paenibacillus polymyxa M1]
MENPNQGQSPNQFQQQVQYESGQQPPNQSQNPFSNSYPSQSPYPSQNQYQNQAQGYSQAIPPAQGYTSQTKPVDAQFYALLEKLQAVDFVLVELNLYLDTHPDDLQAIEQFNKLTQERTAIANEYQLLYGPLQNFGRAYSKYPWEWSQAPWPWQV